MLRRILATTAVCTAVLLAGCAETDAGANNPGTGTGAADSQPLSGHMQHSPPQAGDTMVTLHTNMGDITIRMFPEEAPRAYENFVTHARNGYYDGVIFHRVMENFMIQGGDPDGTGMGGESIWGHGFGPEFSTNLRHFRGALAMAQSAMPDSIGSQFYIVQNTDDQSEFFAGIAENPGEVMVGLDETGQPVYLDSLFPMTLDDGSVINIDDVFPPEKRDAYALGGTPHLDMIMFRLGLLPPERGPGHTVLGQVWQGMDVVDAIATTPTQPGDRPVSDVVIESTTVFVYGE